MVFGVDKVLATTPFDLVLVGHGSLTMKDGAIFHPQQGEPIHIAAGDTMYFDANSKGTREVLETVRQACLTYKNHETDCPVVIKLLVSGNRGERNRLLKIN